MHVHVRACQGKPTPTAWVIAKQKVITASLEGWIVVWHFWCILAEAASRWQRRKHFTGTGTLLSSRNCKTLQVLQKLINVCVWCIYDDALQVERWISMWGRGRRWNFREKCWTCGLTSGVTLTELNLSISAWICRSAWCVFAISQVKATVNSACGDKVSVTMKQTQRCHFVEK